jgi:hypothetical protein
MPKLNALFKRYLPAEIFSLLCALAACLLTASFTLEIKWLALAGTWGENVGFYGCILWRDIKADPLAKTQPIHTMLLRHLRNMTLEFGVAEALDSFLIRPATMYVCLNLLPNTALAVLASKLIADLFFYIPAMFFYSFRKKYFS